MVKNQEKRFRSFDSEEDTQEESLPIGFELHGEKFEANPEAQGAVILEFVSAGENGQTATAASLLQFLENVMPEDEYKRLHTLLHHPKKITRIEKITEIVSYLVEEYTSRPTMAS